MEPCAIVTGVYLGWSLLAMYPRRVVRPSYRLAQDFLVLLVASLLLSLACRPAALAGLVLAGLAYVMYQDLPAPHITVAERAVLVTGCDHGLGHALALQLDAKGFQVFAGCLFPQGEGWQALVSQASSRLVPLHMDVTSAQQVEDVARTVSEHLKGKALHGVVNNAGILLASSLELMTMADIRRVMEVNYFGMVNVYRAFMPLLRQPRRGTARLVNVASNCGLAPSCLTGAYAASKAAVALVSEILRYELKPLGVDVATIVPSGFKTGILMFDRQAAADRWWDAASPEVREYYGRECFRLTNRRDDARSFLNPDFSPLSNCIEDALLSTNPRPFYYKGLLARSWVYLYCHLPSSLWDKVMPYIGDHYKFPVQALHRKDTQS